MFGSKKHLANIDERIKIAGQQIYNMHEHIKVIVEQLENIRGDNNFYLKSLTEIKLEIDAKVENLRKEFTDKYTSLVESVCRYNRELQLIDSLARNTQDTDLAKLRSALMKPILEERWKQKEQQQAKNIDEQIKTKGAELLQKKKSLEEQYLKLNREGKDTKFIEGQLDVLKSIGGE